MSNGRYRIRTICSSMTLLVCWTAYGQMTPIWTAIGEPYSPWFGWSVSRAGDVNGDGYEDLMVGAPMGKKNLFQEGKIYVYFGGVLGFDASHYWSDVGRQVDAQLGRSVAGGGDLNGDGYDDVAAGAQFYDGGQTDEGSVYGYYGSPGGLSSTPDFILECNQAHAMFGSTVVIPGDVNGDGFDDLVVGSPYYNDYPINEGTAFLYYGSPNGIGSVANWTFDTQQASSYARVYSVGDVNGDGFADFAVTSILYDDGETDEGRVFLFLGSPTGPGPTPDWAFSPDDDYSYTDMAASAGDVNSDGYGDVIIGAHGYGLIANNLTGRGGAFLFLGSAAGLGSVPVWMMEADSMGSSYGNMACGVGDVDGNGTDDVLVCDRDAWAATPQEGRAALYGGTASGLTPTPLWDRTGGQGGARFGHSSCGGMDSNGDGSPEWLVGAPYFDTAPSVETGAVFLYQWSDLAAGSGGPHGVAEDILVVRYVAGVPTLEMAGVIGSVELLVTDAQGRIVIRQQWNGRPLPIAFPQGLYVARVTSDAYQWSKKVVVH